LAIERSTLQPDALTAAERLLLPQQAGLRLRLPCHRRVCWRLPAPLNAHMGTFIVAPLTSGGHRYPFRISFGFDGEDGHAVPDQLRTVDRERLAKRLGVLPEGTLLQVLGVLQEMFAP